MTFVDNQLAIVNPARLDRLIPGVIAGVTGVRGG